MVCYTKTGQRRYIPEQDVLSAIETVLNRIKIPDSLINPLYEEIKNAEISEKQYCQQEIGKLRQEQEKLKAKLDNLFDLRLDGELDRETFETKRNEIQLKIDRMGRKIKTYEKTGNAFTSTILDIINVLIKFAGLNTVVKIKQWDNGFMFRGYPLPQVSQ